MTCCCGRCCLENAFRAFGGVPHTVVIDNLLAAVVKADWFDPQLNPKIVSVIRGALKLSNLLQPDRFEEDLNIRRVRLEPPAPQSFTKPSASPHVRSDQEQRRIEALKQLQ